MTTISEGLLQLVRQAMGLDINTVIGAGIIVFESDDGPILIYEDFGNNEMSDLSVVTVVINLLDDAALQLEKGTNESHTRRE